ncbi:putative mitochondrial protein [Trifolium repens]|nr:putative mitochondrial protein [Trifolium repens]
MATDEGKVKIEKFDGADFGFWKMQIEDYLYQKKLYQPLTGKKPTEMKDDEWKLLDRQALGVIRLSLSRNVAFNIAKEKTTASLMAALTSMYEKPSASNKVHLMRRLFTLRMAEGASAAQHLNELNIVTTQLSSVGIEFDDEVRALILLSSLPDSWSATVTAVSSSSGSTKLKFNDVRDLVLSEEIRRRELGESSSSSVLHTESRGRNSTRGNGRGKSKDRRSKSRNHRSSNSSKAIECWNCGKMGHFKNQCKSPPKNKEAKDEANVASTLGEDDALICSLESKEESWVLDSGASFHATSQKKFFENYVPGNLGKVYLGNEQSCEIVGKCEVKINLSGSVWELKNVRHIPDLTKNLISVGQLASEGYTTVFQGDAWKISKGAMTIARGKKSGTLYKTARTCHLIAIAVNENPNLWHQRLGHMSEKGMKIMHSKGKLPSLRSTEIDICEDCIFGKQKRVSFQTSGRTPKKEKLELVHSDVWGPTTVSSIGGKNYFVTFIDDHSRKVWIYFLKHKSEVFDAFKKWKAMVENETGLKIKKLRTDNGGEYEDTKFKKFCYENGIRMERTVPSTPQHNGVAERMNRTLTERARSLRMQSGLPKQFWAEAVNTAAYLINRGPSVPSEHKIPEEVWSGKEVKLSHLRVFGCVAYVHISDQGRNKLDPKSKKCTFIGYGEDEFGYRLWDDENKKMIRSRDVIFNERVMYKDRHNTTTKDSDVREPDYAELDDVPESPQSEELSESSSGEQPPSLRRSSRPHVPNRRYMDYMLLTDGGEPEDYAEACQTPDASKWEFAMKDEMKSLISNQTWELVELPMGKKALHNKWVYRVKEDHDGSKRYKVRLVVKGFQQKEGVDYTEIFAPVVKLNTIRSVLSIVASEELFLEQLDVKTAFLHGDLDEEIYMHQPEGFLEKGKENKVCRLKKSLYGLKQAPRQWYKKFESFMHKEGFQKCNVDHCCFFKRYNSSYIILLLYVDDMLVAGSDMDEIRNLKKQLSKEFDMKDLGPAKKILGMQITRDKENRVLQLSQAEYINRVLQRFNMGNAKPVSTPLASHFRLSKEQSPQTEEDKELMAKTPYASAIGSLMYAMVCTRPDIGHAVGVVSRFMSNPGKAHWEAVKWILRYLRGTTEKCLYFGKGEIKVQGYVDADFAGEVDHRRSTTGYIFTVGTTAVSWMSRIQKIVAISTTEAEYVAVTEASKELIWLQGLLTELGFIQRQNSLYSDSQSAIHLAKNSAFHSRTKHIDLRYHFIRSLLEDEVLTLKKIEGRKNPADMLTKVVTIDKLKLCSTSVGLLE